MIFFCASAAGAAGEDDGEDYWITVREACLLAVQLQRLAVVKWRFNGACLVW